MSDLKQKLELNRKSHKNGKVWKVLLALTALAGIFGIYMLIWGEGGNGSYEFVKVKRQNIKEIVEITGNVEAGAEVKLGFRQSGQIEKIYFETGDEVKMGDVIAELENSDQELNLERAKASLSAAQANLNQKLAGNTVEAIQIAEARLESSRAAKEKVQVDMDNAVSDFLLLRKVHEEEIQRQQLVVDDAKVKYEYSQRGQTNTSNISELSVETAKTDLAQKIQTSAAQIQQTLVDLESVIINDGNSLLGFDILRIEYKDLNPAQNEYLRIKAAFDPLYLKIKNSISLSTEELKDTAKILNEYGNSLIQASKLVTDGLSKLSTSVTLTLEEIESVKAMLLADASLLSSSLSSLNLSRQKLFDAELGLISSDDDLLSSVAAAKNYYDQQLQLMASLKIEQEIEMNAKQSQISSFGSQLKIQEADILSNQANLNEIKSPPRAVDISYLKAQVSAASVDKMLAESDLDKSKLKAPMDGVLTRKNIEAGEQYTFMVSESFVPVFEMISSTKFKIDANIAEVDIGKINVGDKVTILLDALAGKEFAGTVVSVDPVETKIQDVVFYQAEVIFDEQDEAIKPGMSADVDIVLSEANDVLSIPEKAVIKENGKSFVRILKVGNLERIEIKTGIRSLTGDIEVLEGLSEGQEIILRSSNGRS